MKEPLFKKFAIALTAWENCIASKNDDWRDRWRDLIERLSEALPSGSGFDNGTSIDLGASTSEKLVFHTSYHHMNDGGYYDGWTDHTVIVKPSFIHHFEMVVKGRNKNDIKDYIYQVFATSLMQEVDEEA